MHITISNLTIQLLPSILSAVPNFPLARFWLIQDVLLLFHRLQAEFIESLIVHIIEAGNGTLFQRINRLRHRALTILAELEVGSKREDTVLAVDKIFQMHRYRNARVGMSFIKVLIHKAGVVRRILLACIKPIECIEHTFHLVRMIVFQEIGAFLIRFCSIIEIVILFRLFRKLQPRQIALCHLFGNTETAHGYTFAFRTSVGSTFRIIHHSHDPERCVGIQIDTLLNIFPHEFHLHLVKMGIDMCESLMLEHHSFRSRSLFVLIFHFHHYIIHSVDGYIIRIVMVALHAEVIEVFPEITQMDIITDIGSNRLVCIFKPSGQFNISRSFRSKLKLVVPFVIIGIISMKIIGSGLFRIFIVGSLHHLIPLPVFGNLHAGSYLAYVLRQVYSKSERIQ